MCQCTRRADLALEPDQGAGERFGAEGFQIFGCLTNANEMDWQAVRFGNGDEHTALGCAVELGHDEAGDACRLAERLDLRERVLANRRIQYEDDIMRRGGVEFLHHPDDLGELFHQFGLVLQTASRVDKHEIEVVPAGFFDSFKDQPCGVGTCVFREDRDTRPLAPDRELLDRCSAECVARNEESLGALPGQLWRRSCQSLSFCQSH